MSNKIVPPIYRSVIEDVISSIRSDFDEYGVEEELVDYLQETWEHNLRQTRVAQFAPAEDDDDDDEDEEDASAAAAGGPANGSARQGVAGDVYENARPGGSGSSQQGNGAAAYAKQQQQYPQRPQLQQYQPQQGQGQQQYNAYGQQQYGGQKMGLRGGSSREGMEDVMRLRGGAGGHGRVKKEEPIDSDEEEDRKPIVSSSTSRHPDRKPDVKPKSEGKPDVKPSIDRKPNAKRFSGKASDLGIRPGEEILNSDLDDTEDEDEGEGEEEEEGVEADDQANMVYCIYDKVHHQKNKWKFNLRDGLIRANGKEYLFAKCTGEFEW